MHCKAVSDVRVSILCARALPLMEALHYRASNMIGNQNMQRKDTWFLPGTVTYYVLYEQLTNLKSCRVQ